MSSRLAACLGVLTLVPALMAQEPAARPRTIRTQQVMSEALGGVRTFGLLLPPDYDGSARRYPVLYLLHGSGQRHSTWGRRTLLDHTTGAIVVMPGQTVTAGSEIGVVGPSPAGPAALYFELRVDGRSVDPVQWLNPR